MRNIDIERMMRIINFMEIELSDLKGFKRIEYREYQEDRDKRRSLERCIENVVNASLDIAKILLASQDSEIPDTYRQYFMILSASGLIAESSASRLAEGVGLRNILAHQYLDIRWRSIKKFLSENIEIYFEWLEIARRLVKSNDNTL